MRNHGWHTTLKRVLTRENQISPYVLFRREACAASKLLGNARRGEGRCSDERGGSSQSWIVLSRRHAQRRLRRSFSQGTFGHCLSYSVLNQVPGDRDFAGKVNAVGVDDVHNSRQPKAQKMRTLLKRGHRSCIAISRQAD